MKILIKSENTTEFVLCDWSMFSGVHTSLDEAVD
jgi:hypothetical protein